MLYFTVALLSSFLAVMVVVSALRVRRRIRRGMVRTVPVVDDRAVDQILEKGVLVVHDDAPLDQADIDEEEERFWSERWDEPEAL